MNSISPIVTVICLCYNHEKYVIESLESVINQSYKNIQLIIVDDCSQDDSVNRIEEFLFDKPYITFINNRENLGNCKSFNKAFDFAEGKYIVDLAADDVLSINQIEKQVSFFEKQGEKVGVIYTNAQYIDEKGEFIKNHYDIDQYGEAIIAPPQGDVYYDLIKRYFICPPSMMMRKDVLDNLNGYDEKLAYEDFDFWIRSSRVYDYAYLDEVLVKKRVVRGSLSSKQTEKKMLGSTFRVCEKIFELNRTKKEYKALLFRLVYEGKLGLSKNKTILITKYLLLMFKILRTYLNR